MKITRIRLGKLSVPLRVPFKTALRTVSRVEDVVVELHTDTGAVGYGEAPAHRPHHRGHHRRHRGGHRRADRPRSGGAGGGRLRDRHRPGPEGRGAQHQCQGRRGHGPVGPLRPAAPDPGPQAAGRGPAQPCHRHHHQRQPAPPDGPGRHGGRSARLRLPEGEGGGGPRPGHRPPGRRPQGGGKDVCIRIDANQAWTPRQAVRHPERDAGQGPRPRAGGTARPRRRPGGPGPMSLATAGCR